MNKFGFFIESYNFTVFLGLYFSNEGIIYAVKFTCIYMQNNTKIKYYSINCKDVITKII